MGVDSSLRDTDVVVDLAIATDELKRVYRGTAQEVVAYSRDGRVVRFPANILKPFVTVDGVYGCFRIRFDANNRFIEIVQL